MTDSKEREDFEKWVTRDDTCDHSFPLARYKNGDYEDEELRPQWAAWQARANKVAVPPPGFDYVVWVRQKAFNALIKALHIADLKSIWTDDLDDAWDAFDFYNSTMDAGDKDHA